jgi:hypothetical protein
MSTVAATWAEFSTLDTGSMKKIVSFGGNAFSTDVATAGIFGQAVSAANRQTFAQNIADVRIILCSKTRLTYTVVCRHL